MLPNRWLSASLLLLTGCHAAPVIRADPEPAAEALVAPEAESRLAGNGAGPRTGTDAGARTGAGADAAAARPAPTRFARDDIRQAAPLHAAVNGGVAVLPLPADAPTRLLLDGKPVWQGLVDGQRVAVVGIPLTATAGELTLTDASAQPTALRIAVTEARYPEQRLTLPTRKHVDLSEADQARFAREAAEQKLAYQGFSAAAGAAAAPAPDAVAVAAPARWPSFRWPVAGRLSSAFGLRRVFNGEPRAPHLGLDIAAAQGTPVLAPAAGTVVLTGDYFFNGRTVIIDHGQGLFSMLCHLSRVDVNVGDVLDAGQGIGLVGATGRATGPHLHWTASLNDVRIDPLRLVPAADAPGAAAP